MRCSKALGFPPEDSPGGQGRTRGRSAALLPAASPGSESQQGPPERPCENATRSSPSHPLHPTAPRKRKIIHPSLLPYATHVGHGPRCLRPRGTDGWDQFPRNLALRTDSEASQRWVWGGNEGPPWSLQTHTQQSGTRAPLNPTQGRLGGLLHTAERVPFSKFRAQVFQETV